MEGTQIPINMACSLFPWKYKISEKINERKAETNNNLSDNVNFFNIFIYLKIIQQYTKVNP